MGTEFTLFSIVAVLAQVVLCNCLGNLNIPRLGGPSLGPSLSGPKSGFRNLGSTSNLINLGASGNSLGSFYNLGSPDNLNSLGPSGNLNYIAPPGCGLSTGGSFAVTSASPVSPTGVSVLAENLAIEGPLSIGGNLPFLGTVGIEGSVPNNGSGSVSYSCGSSVGISEKAIASPGSGGGCGGGPVPLPLLGGSSPGAGFGGNPRGFGSFRGNLGGKRSWFK